MVRLSIFDIFKVGVGPSSSHTLGPWRAAQDFIDRIKSMEVDHIQVHLYGSLSKTGRGHATDTAVLLGLSSHDPTTIDTSAINSYIDDIATSKQIIVAERSVSLDPTTDIIFENKSHKKHPNTLTFVALKNKNLVHQETYYSVGGGFVEREGDDKGAESTYKLLYPIDKVSDIHSHAKKEDKTLATIIWENEKCIRSEEEVKSEVQKIFDTMVESVFVGCHSEGVLPGGLRVHRRASTLNRTLLNGVDYDPDDKDDWLRAVQSTGKNFDTINQWVSCFALAVNEQNAAMRRIVTSPTNGAAGVIPAVLLYAYCFGGYRDPNEILRFFLVAGEIGCLFKKNATISAAVGGCQAEIGVSSAMAAAGLAELTKASLEHTLMAAEIAMEHHLGLTCDPILGLVQVPCIERNSMGAIKAITANQLAQNSDPSRAIVNLQQVIETMWETAKAMNNKYKETSEGGLAIKVPIGVVEC